MKLLGHKSADMTALYVKVAQTDLQVEFHQAQSQRRHIAPRPQLHSLRLVQVCVVSSIRYSSLNTRWRCFAELWTTVVPVGVLIALPIALPNSSPKSASPPLTKMGTDWPDSALSQAKCFIAEKDLR